VILGIVLTSFSKGNKQETSNVQPSSTKAKAETATNSVQKGQSSSTASSSDNNSVVNDYIQEIKTTLESGRYPAITVKVGVPVKWTITADAKNLTGCNNQIVITQYNVKQKLVTGENVITFTPTTSGKFGYSCWMGMVRSSITVEK